MQSRVLVGELMDDPGLPEAQLSHALRGLARLNAWSFAASALGWRVSQLGQQPPAIKTLKVLDVACADGLFACALAGSLPTQASFDLEVWGCDINPKAVALASSKAQREQGAKAPSRTARFFVHDMIQGPPAGEYDVVIASLFMHHLSDAHALRVLLNMKQVAKRAVIINDLVRGRLQLAGVAVASRVLSRSPIVHEDSVRSVRAAFSRAELLALCQQAGFARCELQWGGVARMQIVAHVSDGARA